MKAMIIVQWSGNTKGILGTVFFSNVRSFKTIFWCSSISQVSNLICFKRLTIGNNLITFQSPGCGVEGVSCPTGNIPALSAGLGTQQWMVALEKGYFNICAGDDWQSSFYF